MLAKENMKPRYSVYCNGNPATYRELKTYQFASLQEASKHINNIIISIYNDWNTNIDDEYLLDIESPLQPGEVFWEDDDKYVIWDNTITPTHLEFENQLSKIELEINKLKDMCPNHIYPPIVTQKFQNFKHIAESHGWLPSYC